MKKMFAMCLVVSLAMFLATSSGWAEVVRGKVTAMDLNASTLSVQTSEGGSLTLSFDKEDFIVWRGDDEVEAKEVQVGNEAEIGYYADEAGAKIASWVDLTPLEEVEGEEIAPEAAETPAAAEEMGEATQEHPGTEVGAGAKERPGKEHPGN